MNVPYVPTDYAPALEPLGTPRSLLSGRSSSPAPTYYLQEHTAIHGGKSGHPPPHIDNAVAIPAPISRFSILDSRFSLLPHDTFSVRSASVLRCESATSHPIHRVVVSLFTRPLSSPPSCFSTRRDSRDDRTSVKIPELLLVRPQGASTDGHRHPRLAACRP